MEKDNVMVTVCFIVFNQEKFVKKALNSFIRQKTNFRYEVLIHDDCSTDNTINILQEYQRNYPEIIRVIYEEKNKYSVDKKFLEHIVYPQIRGKYFTICEGDDYYRDDYKLQKQYDIMEQNLNCSMCVHNVQVVDLNDKDINYVIPNENESIHLGAISSDEYLEYALKTASGLFHTTSLFMRSEYMFDIIKKNPKYYFECMVGDMPACLSMALYGSIYYIDEIMTCYKVGTGGFSKDLVKKQGSLTNNMKLVFDDFNEYTNYKYDEFIKIGKQEWDYRLLLAQKKFKAMRTGNYNSYKILSKKVRLYYRICEVFPCVYPGLRDFLNKFVRRKKNEW